MSINSIEMSLELNTDQDERQVATLNDAFVRDKTIKRTVWPGLQSLYLGLSINSDGVEWFIGWFFIYRLAIILVIVALLYLVTL